MEAAVNFVYEVRDITKSVYRTRNLLRLVNNVRLLSNDIGELMKDPNLAKAFWTLVQLMRLIGSLRRLMRSLRSATREGALLGGLIDFGEAPIGGGPSVPLPPVMGFQPMYMEITANRNGTPINLDVIDLSMLSQQSIEAIQQVFEEDAPNIVEDARVMLRQQVINWTGRLSESIQWYPEPMGIRVIAEEYYADWVEEGHQSFTGYHYMQYAADSARMRLPLLVREKLNTIINENV